MHARKINIAMIYKNLTKLSPVFGNDLCLMELLVPEETDTEGKTKFFVLKKPKKLPHHEAAIFIST